MKYHINIPLLDLYVCRVQPETQSSIQQFFSY